MDGMDGIVRRFSTNFILNVCHCVNINYLKFAIKLNKDLILNVLFIYKINMYIVDVLQIVLINSTNKNQK